MRVDPLVRMLVNEARQRRLTYGQFNKIAHQARAQLGLRPPHGPRRLPRILSEDQLEKFYEEIDRAENIQHQVMLRAIFFLGVRVNELCRIEMGDVMLTENKIFIDRGKGNKDRVVLFPDSFALVLQSHIRAHPENRYLFESNRKTRYSTRTVERIVKKYAAAAGLEAHPHLFRHQLWSYLTQEKLTDAQIQLISGHSSKKSLEVYQHITLDHVA